ncbi:RnfH family protein [Rhodoferax sp.]|uniref:RnfH family protein n=1 Tax=Rhodoferax sp. TaxID=50421 RepID=UPI002844F05A|nr:RnfH family protein [Rhodoferax sp.]MDR3371755.1 RnfH family protein [Rhodoferax sp.]
MQITVIYAPAARQIKEVTLTLEAPCHVLSALQQSGLLYEFPEIDNLQIVVGIWGHPVGLKHLLRDRDRVEVYRPLRVDPKMARRERFVKQGARTTGLFVKKRLGAKAGY